MFCVVNPRDGGDNVCHPRRTVRLSPKHEQDAADLPTGRIFDECNHGVPRIENSYQGSASAAAYKLERPCVCLPSFAVPNLHLCRVLLSWRVCPSAPASHRRRAECSPPVRYFPLK